MAGVQRRVGLIFGLFLVLLVVAAGRTVYLGVLRGGALRRAASDEQLSYETVSAPRGTITDRGGVDLAVSEPAQDISADPYLITDPLAAVTVKGPTGVVVAAVWTCGWTVPVACKLGSVESVGVNVTFRVWLPAVSTTLAAGE